MLDFLGVGQPWKDLWERDSRSVRAQRVLILCPKLNGLSLKFMKQLVQFLNKTLKTKSVNFSPASQIISYPLRPPLRRKMVKLTFSATVLAKILQNLLSGHISGTL